MTSAVRIGISIERNRLLGRVNRESGLGPSTRFGSGEPEPLMITREVYSGDVTMAAWHCGWRWMRES
jgi:hypothetical protein